MLWCSSTVALPGRIPRRPTRIGPEAAPRDCGARVYVCVARTSTLRGYASTDSMKERSRANPCAPSRVRALNSGTSVSNSEVTSMTGAPASETASTSNARRMVSLFAAPTARAMGRSGSATIA